jgi:hypothetical protein
LEKTGSPVEEINKFLLGLIIGITRRVEGINASAMFTGI